jgi:hypothetical protein
MLIDTARTPEEKAVAETLLGKFNEVREAIPAEYQDVDKQKE